MNTSRKGNRYEWRFKRLLEARPGIRFVLRTAGSHGPFDLVSLESAMDGTWTGFWQLTTRRMSCAKATGEMKRLWTEHGMPIGNVAYYWVHRTKETEYCEH